MTLTEFHKRDLPTTPGVYLFRVGSDVLYVGKATNLRERVRSYFTSDLAATRGERLVAMRERADAIETISTDSVLEALLLEAELIKKYQPPANAKEKDDKSFNHIVITREEWPRVLVIRGGALATFADPIDVTYGPFPHGSDLKVALKLIRRPFPFRDTCEPAAPTGGGKPCFNRQIGLCPGVCTGEIAPEEYRERIRELKLFLAGGKRRLVGELRARMDAAAAQEQFEEAQELRNRVFALEHIHDVALIKRERHATSADGAGYRIEAYDIAHISGTSTVGVMTVVVDGEPLKDGYRKFRIRRNTHGSDTDALTELLSRRMRHDEWPAPNLIVVDGGRAQLNAAATVLRELVGAKTGEWRLASVQKDERHRPERVLGDPAVVRDHYRDILLANAEAHRFALAYHRELRGRLQ